jgi:hypothetical protein
MPAPTVNASGQAFAPQPILFRASAAVSGWVIKVGKDIIWFVEFLRLNSSRSVYIEVIMSPPAKLELEPLVLREGPTWMLLTCRSLYLSVISCNRHPVHPLGVSA